jgi:serine/threonine-protein kinase
MDRVNVNPLAISRDGRHVVFRGRSSEGSKLYVRSLESFDAIPIVEGVSESAIYDVSPDGESVIFWDRHLIKRAKIGGGPTATIREVAKASLGLNWGQDGTIVFSEGQVDGSRLMSTDTSGRPIATLTKPAAEGEAHILPHLLDDGSAVLYTVVEVGSEAPKRIEVFSLSTGEVKSLAEGVSPQVSSSGHLLFGRDGAIWAARFDAERLELTGDPLVVLENVAFNTMFSPVFDVADDGSMVYQRAEDVSSELTLAWIDHAGRSLELDLGELVLYEPRVAPDGRRVAVRRGRRNSLWVLALDRNAFTRLSDELVLSVLWHPSGKKIAYTPWKNVGNLYWRNADGTGTEERLTTSPRSQWASDWSQDGMALLYTECDGVYGEACDIGQVLMAEERVAESVLATPANEQHPTLSPDGRWLAYESDQSGRFEIYVRPYPDVGAGRWQISISGGRQPVWSPEGDMLYYVAGPAMAREMLAVSVNTNDGFESGVPEYLFSFAQEGYSELRSHDLHPDGDRFVIATRDTVRRNDEQLVYVLNWLDEVKRLVPINH